MATITLSAIDRAIAFIKSFEGCRLRSYEDANGIWTIGYGATGPDIDEGTVWTQDRADDDLTERVGDLADQLDRLVIVPLVDCQSVALLSFAYNVGLGAFKTSTLLKLLNDNEYASVPAQLTRWVHDGHGKVLPGLVARRRIEGEMWAGSYRQDLAA